VIAAPVESPPALGVVPPLEPVPGEAPRRRLLTARSGEKVDWWTAPALAG